MKTALVIDDHPITHVGAARLLTELGYDPVLKAMNRDEAIDHLRRATPHLVLLDISMPDDDGLALMPALRRKLPATPIMIFTMNDSSSYAARALKLGATGFLSKDAEPDDFIAAIRAVEAGDLYLSHRQAMELACQQNRLDPLSQLTERECQVLRMLGAGHSNQQIANDLHISYKTVSNTTTVLRKKLGVSSSAALIRIALEKAGR